MSANRSKRLIPVLTIVGMALFLTSARADDLSNGVSTLRQTSRAFTTIAKQAIPAVVFIEVEKAVGADEDYPQRFPYNDPFDMFGEDFFDRFFKQDPRRRRRRQPFSPSPRQPKLQQRRRYYPAGQGSGFIISENGYIVTNHHVVGNADRINVTLDDGRKFKAKYTGSDERSDVAMIKIDAKNLPLVPLGDSEKLEIGEWVVAIGNPFGLDATLTTGVVSAKGRSGFQIAEYEDFIQTDAAINPGNSGGPLLNLEGRVVGINTAILSRSGGYMGIGLAIPINMAKSIKDQLIESGEVTRGYLGVIIQDVDQDIADAFDLDSAAGALISDVLEDGPAANADLKNGDIILEFEGKKVQDAHSLKYAISQIAPGATAKMLIYRDGDKKEVKVKIDRRDDGDGPLPAQETETAIHIGFHVDDITDEMASRYDIDAGLGVIVTQVDRGSEAERKGIKSGAIILTVDRREVNSVAQFNRAVKKARDKGKILLLIKEAKYTRYVSLKLEE